MESDNNQTDTVTTPSIKTDNFKKDTIVQKDYLSYKDSVIYDFKKYYVKSIPYNGDIGNEISVLTKQNNHILKISGGNFMDIIGKYMILDFGSSASRFFEIYDLESEKKIYSGGYEAGTLEITKKFMRFKTQVEINEDSEKPTCPDEFKNYENQVGYVEEQLFDFKDLKIVKTGKIECWMFE